VRQTLRQGPIVYADHDGVRSGARFGQEVWMELFEEGCEIAARSVHGAGRWSAEYTHQGSRSCEGVRGPLG
jgi:hypothetical protein